MHSHKLFQVAVGTKNPAKIEAVKLGFTKLFPDIECIVIPADVDSNVGVQPYGFESTIQGAINRAKNAYFAIFDTPIHTGIQMGIGIEAGMIPVPLTSTGYLDYQFCAVYLSNGSISVGSGPGFEYPAKIVDILLNDPNHLEIGTIIAEISGIENTKENEGAIGLLTKNIFRRADILQYSVISALLPIKSPDLYSR
ncbi:MAG: inosine/xanthosine triphosphatase [Promethearchaeota archaeon]|nr:MAG: inosine/xanthosine triphosphatase [Candidatus Lokiarchaeota archaeon]